MTDADRGSCLRSEVFVPGELLNLKSQQPGRHRTSVSRTSPTSNTGMLYSGST
jgi:hypothetical protein